MENIIAELNLENGSNHKIAVLKKHKDNKLLQRLLKMTYDKKIFTYGITMKNIPAYTPQSDDSVNLEWALDSLELLADKTHTGNSAIDYLHNLLTLLTPEDADIIEKVIKRDQRINMGRSNINKVFKGLITKPIYMRCDIGTKKNIDKNISFPAIVNLKADGTYREYNGSFISRSGEDYSYQDFETALTDIPQGYLHGEMTVICDETVLALVLPKMKKADLKSGTNEAEKLVKTYNEHKEAGKEYILPRGLGNGLLNSDHNISDNIVFEVWDFVTPEDYAIAGLKDRKNLPKETYEFRFENLKNIISEVNHPRIRIIEHKIVNNIKEAYEFTSEKMKEGLEGAILKDFGMVYKDGTSKQQLKLKLEIDAEVRVTGFIEGKKGTKRELTFGSLVFETDDGMVKGSTSGFNDEMLELINADREAFMGRVFTVQFNDITKGRGSETYALSHPRFIEFRDDKDTTDDIARLLELKEMAMNLS